MSDNVNHPAHYNQGSLEVWDAIDGLKLGFYEANILKYIARAPFKGTEMQDLQKAKCYLERLIKLRGKEQ